MKISPMPGMRLSYYKREKIDRARGIQKLDSMYGAAILVWQIDRAQRYSKVGIHVWRSHTCVAD